MVSHRAINGMMQTPKNEVHFFFFSVFCIVFNCSLQLIMFDKKQKNCVKRIHLVTDDGLYDRKAFYKVKIVFYLSSMNDGKFINYNGGPPDFSTRPIKRVCYGTELKQFPAHLKMAKSYENFKFGIKSGIQKIARTDIVRHTFTRQTFFKI